MNTELLWFIYRWLPFCFLFDLYLHSVYVWWSRR